MEHLNGEGVGQGAHRLHDLTRGADGTCNDHLTLGSIGHLARQFGGDAAQLMHAVLRVVQLEAGGIGAEGIGQEQIAARIHRETIELGDLGGLVGVPQFGRVARHQPHVEQIGARGPIGEQCALFSEKIGECVAHGGSCWVWEFRLMSRGPLGGNLIIFIFIMRAGGKAAPRCQDRSAGGQLVSLSSCALASAIRLCILPRIVASSARSPRSPETLR